MTFDARWSTGRIEDLPPLVSGDWGDAFPLVANDYTVTNPTTGITATDFFCGMGGSSTGLTEAGIEIKLAANHWARAIETHSANHPNTEHLCADLQAVDLRYLPKTDILWASPICTELSPAGGRRRKGHQNDLFEDHGHVPNQAFQRTRTTFWEVIRAAEIHRYDAVLIENVVEAASWELFDIWLAGMRTLGYNAQFVSVSAAHVGSNTNPHAPQWRDRMYIVFTREGIPLPDITPRPVAYCPDCDTVGPSRQQWKQPNGPRGRLIGKYGQQYIYVCERGHRCEPLVAPAERALDLTNIGTRIGDRKRRLADGTMRRIEHAVGMLNRGEFGPEIVFSVNHDDGRAFDASTRPLPAQTTSKGEALLVAAAGNTYDAATRGEDGYIRAWPAGQSPTPAQTTTSQLGVITMLRANGKPSSLSAPLATLTTGRNHGLILKSQGGHLEDRHAVQTTTEPLPAMRARSWDFLVVPYRKGNRPHLSSRPISALTTREAHGLIQPAVEVEDCYFRMLTPREAANAQRFAGDYRIHGNQGEQQMQAGNAVAVNVAQWIGGGVVEALS